MDKKTKRELIVFETEQSMLPFNDRICDISVTCSHIISEYWNCNYKLLTKYIDHNCKSTECPVKRVRNEPWR